jgi:ribA/ribD-fused uncharacterized protein
MQESINNFSDEFHFLSNFYYCKVIYDGYEYPSSEHAYMCAKTNDPVWKDFIRNCRTPGQAKRAGRMVPLREDWETVKLEVMENILRAKFSVPSMREMLLLTGDCELVEGNTWGDKFWGVCDGEGENHLGKLLMKIRAELAKEYILS